MQTAFRIAALLACLLPAACGKSGDNAQPSAAAPTLAPSPPVPEPVEPAPTATGVTEAAPTSAEPAAEAPAQAETQEPTAIAPAPVEETATPASPPQAPEPVPAETVEAPPPVPPAAPVVAAAAPIDGGEIYNTICAVCHRHGLNAAHKYGNKILWGRVIAKGREQVYANSVKGIRGMPPRGGLATLSDAEVRAGVDYMVNGSGGWGSAPP